MSKKTRSSILNWNKFLKLNPSYREVNRVINYKDLHDRAIERMINKNLSAEKLQFIMDYYEDLTEKAGRVILEKNPNRENLFFIMKKVPDLREQAFQKFIKKNPLEEELLDIVLNIKPLRKKAWRFLALMHPSVEVVEKVLHNVPELRREAKIMIAEQVVPYNVSKKELKEKFPVVQLITDKEKTFSREDFKEFLASDLSNDNDILMKIVYHYNKFDREVWNKLQNISYIRNKDILHMIKFAPSIKYETLNLLVERTPNNEDLVDLICSLGSSRLNTIIVLWEKLKSQNPTNSQLYEVVGGIAGEVGFLKKEIKRIIRDRVKYINKLRK